MSNANLVVPGNVRLEFPYADSGLVASSDAIVKWLGNSGVSYENNLSSLGSVISAGVYDVEFSPKDGVEGEPFSVSLTVVREDWKVVNDDGTITIRLRRRKKFMGQDVDSLTMRDPVVSDVELAEKVGKGVQTEINISLYANLCGVRAEDIRTLAMHDYLHVDEAYNDFLFLDG